MKREKLAVSGALFAAIGASLCCVGPLVFAVFGLGAFGASAVLAPARPYLLTGAVLILVFGFYVTYWRRPTVCAPGEECASNAVPRSSKIVLWLVSGMVVAFALMPYYIGYIGSALTENSVKAATAPIQTPGAERQFDTITIQVDGMDCASCEIPIRAALKKAVGVREADVSFERGNARVTFDPRQTNAQQIKGAIDSTGYRSR